MGNIQEQINTLIKLQELDGQIYKLSLEKDEKPAQKDLLKGEFSQKKNSLIAREEELKVLQLRKKECEIELETKENEIKKYQGQLLQLKTNKEYLSLQKQIGGLKADNGVLEEEILGLMDKIDQAKAAVDKEKGNFAQQEKELEQDIAGIDQQIKEITDKISMLENQKAKIAESVDKNIFSRYQRIVKAKQGLAFVPINGESCGGCHRVLPPQVINEAKIKNHLVICEFCARILYSQ